MPITYNAGENRIYFEYVVGDPIGNSLANPYTAQSIYDADVAGGWGVVRKDGNVYNFDCVIRSAGTSTYFKDDGSVLYWESSYGTATCLDISTIGGFEFDGTVFNSGSAGNYLRFKSYTESTIKNCAFYSVFYVYFYGAYGNYLNLFNSVFNKTRYIFIYSFVNVDSNTMYSLGNGLNAHLNTNYNNLNIDNCVTAISTYLISSGTHTIQKLKITNSTYHIQHRAVSANTNRILNFNNCAINYKLYTYSAVLPGTDDLYANSTFNFQCGDGVDIEIKDQLGNTHYSGTHDNNDEELISFMRHLITLSGGAVTVDTITDYEPFTITVSKANYKDSVIPNVYATVPDPDNVGQRKGKLDSTYIYAELERECLQISAVEITDISAAGLSDGSLTVTAIGGDLTYEYSIDNENWQASNEFTGLAAADYTVYVRSGDGQTADFEVTVSDAEETPPQITAVSISNVTTVGGSDGSLTVTATGVNTPLTYSIGGDFQSSNIFTGLPANTYTITVKDSRDNVSVIEGVRISQPKSIYYDAAIEIEIETDYEICI